MSERIKTSDVSPGPAHSEQTEPSVPATVDLYESRKKIHPKSVKGFFHNIRTVTVWGTMMFYLIMPWLNWGDRQMLLFDLPERQFYILGLTFFPQDFVFLSWMLIIAAFTLLFFTVLAGRVFCGYVCPQTTWTSFFMWIEKLTEGERNARLKLDKAPMSVNKFVRRGSKHFLFLSLALLTGLTFVGYFSPIRELAPRTLMLDLGSWEAFWIIFFSMATYINAGWMREQVCMYMCPYARFQSAMFDKDTLIVSYDLNRGEPRTRGAKRKKVDVETTDKGDCIDCGLCVQVCPTGIDIRDGLQYECITCALCIDACDSVMDKINKPRGLVRYSTEHALEGQQTHIIRPRMIGYGLMIGLMIVLFISALWVRVPIELDIIRDRNNLFRETSDGLIENVYTLKVFNKTQQAHAYELSIEAPEGYLLNGNQDIHLEAGAHTDLAVRITVDPFYNEVKNTDIQFTVTATTDDTITVTEPGRFVAIKRR